MSRKKTKVEQDMKKTVSDLTEQRSKILEDFAKAYMVEKGVLPSQIRLVERQMADRVEWNFALKDPEPTGLKKQWFLLKYNVRTLKLRFNKPKLKAVSNVVPQKA